jgi:hypothetical protein
MELLEGMLLSGVRYTKLHYKLGKSCYEVRIQFL